jgi:arabinogalactan oligomer / maltooligosaccharide transport system permease protein
LPSAARQSPFAAQPIPSSWVKTMATDIDKKTYSAMNVFEKAAYHLKHFFKNVPSYLKRFFRAIGSLFIKIWQGFLSFWATYFEAFRKGDWATRLSFVVFGIGYFKRKQWARGLFLLAFQIGVIVLFVYWGYPYLSNLNLQNIKDYTCTYNKTTKKNECSGDNSFLILLYSLIMIVVLIAYVVIYFMQVKDSYANQVREKAGRRVSTFSKDIDALLNERFHTTLLAFPILGIVIFTIVPILFMICIAFTNYDVDHLPPKHVFSWVGWSNFSSIFSSTMGSNFSYAFQNVLSWTLVWAVFSTITCYFGGLVLALLINSHLTKLPKMWRTIFVITIAVPQFVSLMLIRYFFYDTGIVNTMLGKWGVIDWLKSVGWITTDYIPFFTNPTWIKVSVIFVNMWIGIPYMMLITTGILMNIRQDLYESARIDGAGKTRIFWSITMPYILTVTGPYLISSFVSNLNNFNVIYLLTADYTSSNIKLASVSASESDLLITWLFKMTVNDQNYKMASVIGIMIFLLSSFFTLIAFNQTIKGKREERFQ